MDYEPLQIKDSEKSTKGGPPGWLAFSVIIGAFVVTAAIAFTVGLLI